MHDFKLDRLLPPVDDHTYGYHHQDSRQKLWSRESDSRKQQLIRPQPLDKEAAESISCQIQEEYLSMEPLMPSIEKHKNQYEQTPQRLIEKCRMNLDIGHPLHRLHMLPHEIRNIRSPDCVYRKPHGKNPVRIFAKCFPVEEIPPPSVIISQ